MWTEVRTYNLYEWSNRDSIFALISEYYNRQQDIFKDKFQVREPIFYFPLLTTIRNGLEELKVNYATNKL